MQTEALNPDRSRHGEVVVPVEPAEPEVSPALRILSLAARFLLGGVFLVAGAEKLGAMKTFGKSIAAYQILPEQLANIAALLFVWGEITVGILLIAGAFVRGSSLVTSGMLVIFLIAILAAMARGLDIDCGCFPGHPEPVGWKKVLEDIGLLAVAVYLIYFPKSYMTMESLKGKV
jgi:uncharacterized membrane protein YphA (DoxX/SURF4 family)